MSSAEPRAWVEYASVALGWFAEVAQSERAVALLDAQPAIQLIAPDLVLVELLNAGWKAQRQGVISEEQFLAIGELAPILFSELVPAAALLARDPCRHQTAGRLSAGGGPSDHLRSPSRLLSGCRLREGARRRG